MKIAYISSAFLSDCDMPLLREMTAQGAEVYYFLQMSDSSRQATIINVKEMKSEGRLYAASDYPELANLSRYIPLERIFVVNMPSAHDWALSSMKAVWQLYRFIKRESFDVVHLTSPLRYGSFLLYLLRNKMVLTMHDPLPHSSDMGRLNRLHRWVALRAVNHFIILSESLREGFVKAYGMDKRGKHIHLSCLGAYDVLHDVTPMEMELPEKFVLFVGSINPHKGIYYLCEAMRMLNEKHPDLHLVIAGRGQFDFNIEDYIDDCKITLINRFVKDEELVTLLQRSQFTVCPYKDATQSGVIMSAFALEKPVLATEVGALPEMMEHGRHGMLVPPCDAMALAGAISEMQETSMLSQMKQNIREDFSFGVRSWSHIAKETLEIYSKVKGK